MAPVIAPAVMHSVKSANAQSRLEKEGKRFLTVIYGADGKAEWFGNNPISIALLAKAKGRPTTVTETGSKTQGIARCAISSHTRLA